MKRKLSKIMQLFFFLLIMFLTFYAVFSKNDLSAIIFSIRKLNLFYFMCAASAAVFFVCMEGFMIWYLLRACLDRPSCCSQTSVQSTDGNISLFRCFSYSFTGFFFSGITPSATGGQPAQLIAMKKDGIPLSYSTLALMTVAVFYKLILAVTGLFILLFWKEGLSLYFGNYMPLYYFGIFLNAALVLLLLLIMFHGNWMEGLLLHTEQLGVKIHLFKPSNKRKETLHHLISDYQEMLPFLLKNKPKILFTAVCTFLQRCSLFLLTYFIYRGFGLSGYSPLLIMTLQASVYISVDMLPLPGSQGISELLYVSVFAPIFTDACLPSSMCVTRGLSFYFLLIIGAFTAIKDILM